MPFQLNAKNILLTYAQCAEPKEDLLEHLKQFGDGFIRVGHELHQDGGHHLHAVMRFTEPVRTKSQKFFDWRGFHPNIVGCRNPDKATEYAGKDGDFIDYGENPTKKSWASLCSGTEADFWNGVKTDYARDYVLNLEKLQYFATAHFKKEIPQYVSKFENFITPVELDEWFKGIDQVIIWNPDCIPLR